MDLREFKDSQFYIVRPCLRKQPGMAFECPHIYVVVEKGSHVALTGMELRDDFELLLILFSISKFCY